MHINYDLKISIIFVQKFAWALCLRMKAIFSCKCKEPLAQQCITFQIIRIYSVGNIHMQYPQQEKGEGSHGIIKICRITKHWSFVRIMANM